MADELDMMLQGDDQSQGSQPQQSGPVDDSNTGQPLEQQTPEEIEFNSLTGSTQDRIRRLVKDKRELMQRMEATPTQQYIPPAPNSNFVTPEEEAAIRTLSQKGLSTDAKVDAKIDDRLNMLRWDMRQQSLESRYTGANGEPQYVREEVEDFIRSHPQFSGYDPEDVFKDKMFRGEFLNLELQKRSTGPRTGQTQTLRPTSRQATAEQGLTPEFIAERTDIKKYPDALEWQEEHRQQIDAVLSQMSSE